jgi:hypothetical protein
VVELDLAADPTATRLCLERILPPCRERAVNFALPPIAGRWTPAISTAVCSNSKTHSRRARPAFAESGSPWLNNR